MNPKHISEPFLDVFVNNCGNRPILIEFDEGKWIINCAEEDFRVYFDPETRIAEIYTHKVKIPSDSKEATRYGRNLAIIIRHAIWTNDYEDAMKNLENTLMK